MRDFTGGTALNAMRFVKIYKSRDKSNLTL